MNIYFADKLKSLRAEKRVSQEKLAQYLSVSFQAVSKWENGNAYPDITLLPDIARFFGVTVDELLCVERIDEKRLFNEYSERAADLFRCGNAEGALALWQEAYQRMPNNIDVREMLMSSYFDADRERYFREFYEIATDIYHGDAVGDASAMYYKGQAIALLARALAERGEMEEARKWARRSAPIFDSMEIIEAMIDSGKDLINDVAFCTYWFLEELFFFACRLDGDQSIELSDDDRKNCLLTVVRIFETVYKNDDAGFEQLRHLADLHQRIAEYEAKELGSEELTNHHLKRAYACCQRSTTVKAHRLRHPLLYGLQVYNAPSDNKAGIRCFSEYLKQSVFDPLRKSSWFSEIEANTEDLLKREASPSA